MKTLIYGIFDWDDNILHMPTLIKAYDTILRKIVWLTTEQYAKIRNTNHQYTFEENSFDLFYDYIPSNFETDIHRALVLKTFGPSFDKFVKMVRDGKIVAIVTARGHGSETLKNGCKFLIYQVFQNDDFKTWRNNLRKYRTAFNLTNDVSDVELENEYWNNCYFVGLGSRKDEIGKKIRKVEDEKKNAISKFVKKIYDQNKKKFSIKIGFSDDDTSNLEKIHELFVSLLNIYPEINFRLYDTSNRALKKIKVK